MTPPLTLTQVAVGRGSPDVLHNTVKLSPSITIRLFIGCMDEATKTKEQELINKRKSRFY